MKDKLMPKKRLNFSKQLKQFYQNHPTIILLSLFLLLVSVIVTANSAYNLLSSTYEKHIGWKSAETDKLNRLAPLATNDYIKSILGEPLMKTSNREKGIDSYVYKGRDYWVKTVTRSADNTVLVLTMTACNDFRPTIKNNPIGDPVKLNVTRMDEVSRNKDNSGNNLDPMRIKYFLSGATAPSFLFDEYYGGNPGRYQTVYAGYSSACNSPQLSDESTKYLLNNQLGNDPVSYDPKNKDIQNIRSELRINTIAITAPINHPIVAEFNQYTIGIDKNEIRIFK